MKVWNSNHPRKNQQLFVTLMMPTSRPLRTRRNKNKLRFINLTIAAFFVVYFCVATFKTLHLLEKQRLVNNGDGDNTSSTVSSFNNNASDAAVTNHSSAWPPGRFILFRKMGYGQGAGNVMNGLLAAHLLGQEFNRTVCVAEGYTEFHAAFEAIDPLAVQYCPDIRKSKANNPQHRLELVNFVPVGENECRVQDMLASDTKIIEYMGNTYCRWPHVERGFFFRFYRARPGLLDILAYDHQHQSPPSTVVHLRAPDPGGNDQRKGLDEDSLIALGEELPRGNATFLVTNQVDWFKRFEEAYGWSHANWNSVAHSGFGSRWTKKGDGRGLVNGKLRNKNNVPRGAAPIPLGKLLGKLPNNLHEVNMNDHTMNITAASALAKTPSSPTATAAAPAVDHNMQMFADWFMLLQAKQVYHTNSDFSNSAVHWMDIDAFVIEGYNRTSHRLILKRESWIIDGESPPLVDRTLEADESNPDKQLRMCPPKVPSILDQRESVFGGLKKEAVHRKEQHRPQRHRDRRLYSSQGTTDYWKSLLNHS